MLNEPANHWDSVYQRGQQINSAPFDEVVSFVYRHKPDKLNKDIKILEVGCGCGNNVVWLAKQGFDVYGIDYSHEAIRAAHVLMHKEKAFPIVTKQDFTAMSFISDKFDMVIDRAALSLAEPDVMRMAIGDIHRVLVRGGKLFFTPYSSYHGQDGGKTYAFSDLKKYMPEDKWVIESVHEASTVDFLRETIIEAHFRIVARKV